MVTHESPAWANIPIEQGKQGKVGGDDEQTKRPEDTEPAEPAEPTEPEDEDEDEPEESGIDTDEHGESDGLHWLSTCRDAFLFEDCVEDSPLRHQLTHEKVQAIDGWISVPDGPGLGVTIDEESLKKFTVTKATI